MNFHENSRSIAWKALLSDHTTQASEQIRAALTVAVKNVLTRLETHETLGTTELGERIWPKSEAKGSERERKRMFVYLLYDGQNNMILPDWRRRVTEGIRNRYGMVSHPWEWFNASVTAGMPTKKEVPVFKTPAQEAMDALLASYGASESTRNRVMGFLEKEKSNSAHSTTSDKSPPRK